MIGVSDFYRGESVKVFVALRFGLMVTTGAANTHGRTSLVGYRVPRVVDFQTGLAGSGAGKQLRCKLRRQAIENRSGSLPLT